MNYKANFKIEGDGAKYLPDFLKDYLIDEYVKRRNVFCNLVNDKYEEWNEEFDTLHPNVDGWSDEYKRFIYLKHQEPLANANAENIGLNWLGLKSDVMLDGDVTGYCERLRVRVYLYLVES